jgi:ABC-2 type transport system ATP-binding protein
MSEIAAVEVKNLVKDFKGPFRGKQVHAVRDVSLQIAPGEVYGLIGPNGSGKSTTMKAVLGLVAPTSGSCAIFGRNSTKVDSRSEVGFLPENPYFYKHLTAGVGRLAGCAGPSIEGVFKRNAPANRPGPGPGAGSPSGDTR